MKELKYAEDLKDIKDIMNRSSRFASLSGLSGVAAGIIGLGGLYFSYILVFKGNDYLVYGQVDLPPESLRTLILVAIATILITFISLILLTRRETTRRNEKLWDLHTKRILTCLAIPLFTGGILCIVFLFNGFIGIIPPLTLIFYGLALENASKYTLSEIRSLGLAEIVLGLLAVIFVEYGLIFWGIGFGILHIGYGIIMHIRLRS